MRWTWRHLLKLESPELVTNPQGEKFNTFALQTPGWLDNIILWDAVGQNYKNGLSSSYSSTREKEPGDNKIFTYNGILIFQALYSIAFRPL